MIKRLLAAPLFLSITSTALAQQDLFTMVPVVPDVYLALARPQFWINSNAVVIILEDAVLVVDSHSKPSAARALIQQIKRITPKPVRYVVNSHFHWDHAQGNQAHVGAWPGGVDIISTDATRENLERIGVVRIKRDIATLPDSIASLKKALAAAGEPAQRTELESAIQQTEAYLGELRSLELVLPTMTFDHALTLRRGPRTVHFLFLGRGHTSGDVVTYLPQERVVATGDLVHVWSPFMGDSYPYDWIRTLGELEKLEFDYVLSGHGPVLKGKDQIRLWREFLTSLMDETASAVAQGLDRARTAARVAPRLRDRFERRFVEGALADSELNPSIYKAYSVIAFGVK